MWLPPWSLLIASCVVGVVNGGLPRGLLEITAGTDHMENLAAVERFIGEHIEPRHAVAIVKTGRGSKRHALLQSLADDEELHHLLCFGVLFTSAASGGERGSSLTVTAQAYEPRKYEGKWIRSHIRDWLLHAAFPLVNRMASQFPPAKYLSNAVFGTVLVVKPLDAQTGTLIDALEKHAERFRDTLKFTFFTKVPSTQHICDMYGVWTNDELLLLEKPRDVRTKVTHSSVPLAPKYRLEGVTPSSIDDFFEKYIVRTWPRYFKAAFARPVGGPALRGDVRELSSWDFVDVVHDPDSSVLVEFVSPGCEACVEFAPVYDSVARRIAQARRKPGASAYMRGLVIARIDQSHEHPEFIKGTPWLRYFPRGERKRPYDLELRSADGIVSFLEGQAVEEEADAAAEEEGKGGRKRGNRRAAAPAQRPDAEPACAADASAGKSGACASGSVTSANEPEGVSSQPAGSDADAAGIRLSSAPSAGSAAPGGAARGYLSTEADDPDEI